MLFSRQVCTLVTSIVLFWYKSQIGRRRPSLHHPAASSKINQTKKNRGQRACLWDPCVMIACGIVCYSLFIYFMQLQHWNIPTELTELIYYSELKQELSFILLRGRSEELGNLRNIFRILSYIYDYYIKILNVWKYFLFEYKKNGLGKK